MARCNPAYTLGAGKKLTLDQQEENLLNEDDKRRVQAISDSVMYVGQVTCYDI